VRRIVGLAVLLLVVSACVRTAGVDGGVQPSSTSRAPTTSVPAPTTTGSTEGTTDSTVDPVDPGLSFPPIETGVLTVVEPVTWAELLEMSPPPEAADGARFEVTACRATWFGRWEIDGVWEPGTGQDLPAEYVLMPVFFPSDYALGGPPTRVSLSGPGAFTLPVSGVHRSTMSGETERESIFRYLPTGLSWSWYCSLQATSDEPVVDHSINDVSAELMLKPPMVKHSLGSLQGWLERLDPLTEDEPWLALVWVIASQAEFPFDEVYMREGESLRQVKYDRRSTCLGLRMVYEDGVTTTQFTGCPPQSPPVRLYDTSEIVRTDSGWNLAAIGADVSQLVPVPWEGHPGAETQDYDPWRYADSLVLPIGTTETARFPFGDGLLMVTHTETDNGQAFFSVEELFTGGGDGLGSSGSPYMWDGCARTDYARAGYALVIVADPTWSVEVRLDDWTAVDMADVCGFGVAVVEGDFETAPRIRVLDTEGHRPPCSTDG